MKKLLTGLAIMVALSGCGKSETPEAVYQRLVGGYYPEYTVQRKNGEMETFLFSGDRYLGKNRVVKDKSGYAIRYTLIDIRSLSDKQRKIMGIDTTSYKGWKSE